jgi:NDP-sugar pyrophosphorylase family protein
MTGVCAVVLAAGEGLRLRPLTNLLPKALCPVGNVRLLDHALRRVAGIGLSGPADVAVNAAHLAEQIEDSVADRAYVSIEPDGPLGTAGGVGNLRDWIGGRAALIGNADAYLADPRRPPGQDIAALLDGWTRDTVRMLTLPVRPGDTGGFSGRRFAGFSLLPWRYIRDLPAERDSLVRAVWRPAEERGELELVGYGGAYLDCGTPADYLSANLHALSVSQLAGGGLNVVDASATVTGHAESCVIGAHAVVAGTATRCVVWPNAEVTAAEFLTDAIRAPNGLTVHPRP